ncbi:hypothetical protein JW823_02010 [bacterium]|nr:hypothetical protein [candidate division CSSED10-310 bacterium]
MQKSLKKTVIGFLLWNLFVFGLWIWSREGSVVHLRMIVDDNHHSLFCNGQLVDSFDVVQDQCLWSGRPGLGLSKDSRPPLVVKAQELYHFTVTDTHSGELLWGGTGPMSESDWTMMKGRFDFTGNNRIRTSFLSLGVVGDVRWQNYAIDVTCANPTELYIIYRMTDNDNYGRAQLRFWRELVVGFNYYRNGDQTFHRIKSLAEPLEQGIRSLMLRFVKVYVMAMLILCGFLMVFLLFSVLTQMIRKFLLRRTE